MNTLDHDWSMDFSWIFLLLIISILYYLFQHKKIDRSLKRSSAQNILDKRYASGGISQKEYEKKSKYLSKDV